MTDQQVQTIAGALAGNPDNPYNSENVTQALVSIANSIRASADSRDPNSGLSEIAATLREVADALGDTGIVSLEGAICDAGRAQAEATNNVADAIRSFTTMFDRWMPRMT